MIKTIIVAILIANASISNAQQLHRYYAETKAGYKNEKNEIVVNPIYSGGSEFENGFALVIFNNKRGFIDNSGKEVISLLYDDATMFSAEGLATVKFGGKYGCINTKGDWIIQPMFENMYQFTEGLARVMKGGKYGFINTAGVLVIPFLYDYAQDFSEGLVAVKFNGKVGFINAKGLPILDFKYIMATSFIKGKAIVKLGDEDNIYINKKGIKIGDVPKVEEEKERDEMREKIKRKKE
jgi:WG containing repeat